jgi:phage shock protein E
MLQFKEKEMSIPLHLINHFRKGELVIVDVRSPMEFIHGHIEGAWNIPFETLGQNEKIMLLWEKPIILCSTFGRRSQWAWKQLRQKGLDVYDGRNWEILKEVLEET